MVIVRWGRNLFLRRQNIYFITQLSAVGYIKRFTMQLEKNAQANGRQWFARVCTKWGVGVHEYIERNIGLPIMYVCRDASLTYMLEVEGDEPFICFWKCSVCGTFWGLTGITGGTRVGRHPRFRRLHIGWGNIITSVKSRRNFQGAFRCDGKRTAAINRNHKFLIIVVAKVGCWLVMINWLMNILKEINRSRPSETCCVAYVRVRTLLILRAIRNAIVLPRCRMCRREKSRYHLDVYRISSLHVSKCSRLDES